MKQIIFVLMGFFIFTSSLSAQDPPPYRFQLPVDIIQDAIVVDDTTFVNVDVQVSLQQDSLGYAMGYQRGVESALQSLDAQVGNQNKGNSIWVNVAWLGLGAVGIVVIAHQLNKISKAVGNDVTVEGDDIEIIVEPPVDHEHEHCWPPGHCKGG